MKRTITVLASLALAATLLPALGCGSGDSTPAAEAPSSPAPQASTPAPPEPPPAMPEKEEMAAGMTPLEECHKLADAEQWLDAVGPCKAAAVDHPDDMKIKHALQQAAAAATAIVEGS